MTRDELAQQAANKHGFISVEAMNDFLLAVYSKAATNVLRVMCIDGKERTYGPADNLIKEQD